VTWTNIPFSMYGMLAAWAAVDVDGFDDLYFQPHSTAGGKLPLLWRNTKGRFHLVPDREIAPKGWTHSAGDTHMGSRGDFNKDGRPDLFIANGGSRSSTKPHVAHLLENARASLSVLVGEICRASPVADSIKRDPAIWSARKPLAMPKAQHHRGWLRGTSRDGAL
jgi:hypothetical protein